MCTRGGAAHLHPPEVNKPVVLRCSTGATLLKELSNEVIGVTLEDALRLNASAVTCQVCIGDEHEKETLDNLGYLINEGNRYGVPTLGVTAVGKRDGARLALPGPGRAASSPSWAPISSRPTTASRVSTRSSPAARCRSSSPAARSCPELDALNMAYKAIDQGALGVDMGRNIFAADDPVAMAQAVAAVVHQNEKPDKAFEMYNTLKSQRAKS